MSYRQPAGNGLCVGRHRHDPDRPRKAADGGHLCLGCVDRLTRLLQALPDLVDDLERALLNGAGIRGAKVSGNPERALPYNDDAGAARRTLLDVLGSWTRLIAEDRGEHLPSDLSPRGQTEWHGYRLAVWTVAQVWIDEYATNLAEAVAEGHRVLAGARTRTLTLGACVAADRCDVLTRAELPCYGQVQARLDLVDELLPAAVACSACGQEHTARELPALGKALTGGHAWLTTAQAAAVLGLSQSRVRAYAAEEGWRRRDAEGVRPSRWHADDVQAHTDRMRGVSA